MHLLLLFLPFFRVAGSYEITGPNAVRGLVGGSLTVECCYASTWKTYSKWWCRGSIWRRCNILVQTTGSEQKVKKNKVSIRDNQKNFTFSVTMEELTETDTDIYWCGIEKSGTDLGVEVKVTIDPAPAETKDPPTVTSSHSNDRDNAMTLSVLIPTILAVLLLLLVAASLLTLRIMKQQKKAAEMSPEQVRESPRSDQRPQTAPFSPSSFPSPKSTEVQMYQTNYVPKCLCAHSPPVGPGRMGSGCWKQPEVGGGWKGAGVEVAEQAERGKPREAQSLCPSREEDLGFLSKVLQPQEGDLCYANLTLQPTQISRNSSKKKACAKPSLSVLDDQLEVEYVTMAPLSKEDISYAALSWELSNQEPTYCNMGRPDTHVPSRSQQEHMEYSTIKRP
ncbi:CMRF35-like molecule 1 isoform X2 [Canis lupus dingo]|uniref:CMRF35-like molecule 1 isoform X2 n=1 Tax=Canis lupus familiaris TaxID=9615 RepID=UPI000DC670A1|nr:CMRF35-like molecule 1 isoform X2 [Canis lupus familiaris]XP_048969881.1 CMRF35-like molecule 1 isoform X2 [Canis lupus dingo]